MEVLKNAKDNFVTEFKTEIEKSEPIELQEIQTKTKIWASPEISNKHISDPHNKHKE